MGSGNEKIHMGLDPTHSQIGIARQDRAFRVSSLFCHRSVRILRPMVQRRLGEALVSAEGPTEQRRGTRAVHGVPQSHPSNVEALCGSRPCTSRDVGPEKGNY